LTTPGSVIPCVPVRRGIHHEEEHRTSNVQHRTPNGRLCAMVVRADCCVSPVEGSCLGRGERRDRSMRNAGREGRRVRETVTGGRKPRVAPGSSRCGAAVLLSALSSLRSTISKCLVLPTKSCSNWKRNMLYPKTMKPVFHSAFDVGRSMFDVLFSCGRRPRPLLRPPSRLRR
jgi:hypothetical protein